MKRNQFLLLIVLVASLLVIAAPAMAQGGDEPTADEVNAIAKNLFCPVCENVPLDACGTAACSQWRQQIKDLLIEGRSEEEIYDYFVELYGDRVLAAPPVRGLNWLVYVVPPLAILIGGWVTYKVVSSRKEIEVENQGAAPAPDLNQTEMKRIEDELKKRR